MCGRAIVSDIVTRRFYIRDNGLTRDVTRRAWLRVPLPEIRLTRGALSALFENFQKSYGTSQEAAVLYVQPDDPCISLNINPFNIKYVGRCMSWFARRPKGRKLQIDLRISRASVFQTPIEILVSTGTDQGKFVTCFMFCESHHWWCTVPCLDYSPLFSIQCHDERHISSRSNSALNPSRLVAFVTSA